MIPPNDICPVCGYADLDGAPWTEAGGGSLEICPSCDIQFGYTDAAGGDTTRRTALHAAWRRRWMADGMPWSAVGIPPPPNWDPAKQVSALLEKP